MKNHKVYMELLEMFDPAEALFNNNPIHIEIMKRIKIEDDKEKRTYWRHPDKKPYEEMTEAEFIELVERDIEEYEGKHHELNKKHCKRT